MYATNVAIVPGTYVMGAGITTPVLVKGYGTLTPCATTGFPMCGTYVIDNPGSLSVSSETMTLSGVTEGGAIAPGAALTVENPGTGATYPVANWSTMTGVMPFTGKYSTSLLGGTPSHIQAQISATPGGAALSGCSACAWTDVSGETISGGVWSGSVVNIPAGGPYWVSLRAANGTAYATLPNAVFVGANVAGFGEGNAVDQVIGTAVHVQPDLFPRLFHHRWVAGCWNPSAGQRFRRLHTWSFVPEQLGSGSSGSIVGRPVWSRSECFCFIE